MESFAPALIAVMLVETAGRLPLLAAILADRTGAILSVLAGMLLANALVQGLAGAAGALVAPVMGAEARSLLVAIAFGLAALGFMRRPRIRDRMEGWRIGALPTAFIGLASLGLGGSGSFLTFALAARSGEVAAGVGGAIGATLPAFVAMALGEAGWLRLPMGWIRLAVALGCAGVAVWAGLTAFRLI